ncbi:hypothetical protein LTS10_002639 [Elasticomyces elasticus]|nr:hypothetical protein LTS10_002639 [Elasticomyces elasticus]
MADNTSAPLPKASKILNIKRRTNFLSLARELRDMIYEYALVQPSYWNKPHERQCPLVDPKKAWQWPVYRSSYDTIDEIFYNSRRPWHNFPPSPMELVTTTNPLTAAQIDACFKAGCHKRLSISLRLANRQIYTETDDMFWAENTFCYKDKVHMLHDLSDCVDSDEKVHCDIPGPCDSHRMPKSAKAKICRLSLLQYSSSPHITHQELNLERRVILMLNMLPNLEEVELPARIAIAHLSKLSHVNLPYLDTVHATEVRTCSRLLGRCDRSEIASGQAASDDLYCIWCYLALYNLTANRLETWMDRWRWTHSGPDRVERAVAMTQEHLCTDSGVPTQLSNGVPRRFLARIGDEADEGEIVTVHGLPIIDAAARLELRKAERKQKPIKVPILPGVRSRKRANLHFPPTDKEVVVPCRADKRRERQRPVLDLRERLPQPDERSARLVLRAQRHEEEARHEAQKGKDDAKASAMEMMQAMQQLSLDRKAAKKRSGRR